MINHLPGTLFEKPDWLFAGDDPNHTSDKPLWSGGTFPLPSIGDYIAVTMDGWEGCKGVVVGYRVDDCRPDGGMWVGVCVLMDQRPRWHVKDNPTRNVCFFVGCEVEDAHAA